MLCSWSNVLDLSYVRGTKLKRKPYTLINMKNFLRHVNSKARSLSKIYVQAHQVKGTHTHTNAAD